MLFNISGVVHAIDNTCPHNGEGLASGRLNGHVLQYPVLYARMREPISKASARQIGMFRVSYLFLGCAPVRT